MNLLEAVNTVLPYLGSHVVTSLEDSRNPTVNLILQAMERHRKGLITKGWWFNITNVDLPVNVDKRIQVPTYCVSIYGKPPINVEIQGSYLFDLDNNTRYFNSGVSITMIKDTSFEELPIYAQMVVVYKACSEVYLQDFEYNNTLQLINNIVAESLRDLEQEDIRKRRYNSLNNYTSKYKSMRRPYR